MTVILNSHCSRFELEENGLLAVAEYELDDDVMTVTHVVVPFALRGGGRASALAAEVVDHARREQLKIVPQCSFMVAYCQRHPEINDILA